MAAVMVIRAQHSDSLHSWVTPPCPEHHGQVVELENKTFILTVVLHTTKSVTK